MPANSPLSLAESGATLIRDAFNAYQEAFMEITSRSRSRFEARDWAGAQRDAIERLDLYRVKVELLLGAIRDLLGKRAEEKALWEEIKLRYAVLVTGRDDIELAKTFFNSTVRKIIVIIGTEPDIEFLFAELDAPPIRSEKPIYRSYPGGGPIRETLIEIFRRYEFAVGFADLERDAGLVAQRVEARLLELFGDPKFVSIDVIKTVFYRGSLAFIVGRIQGSSGEIPMALALRNPGGRIVVDAALLQDDEVSIVFSFTRSYFHVKVRKPKELVDFLKTIMPQKPVAELYISIGYNKHGKTQLYRDLYEHLQASNDQFEIARGEKGMVMSVFTFPSYDIVFKIIKDRFSYTKKTTRQQVRDKYQLVFRHDRAGRLVDAQEFEHLEFSKSRFSDELLEELSSAASKSVSIRGDTVILKHLYTERRVTPLNIYMKEAPAEKSAQAVIDFGNALKDLAAANIFPGDILLKNFGVTRHGRVVFYDYDELSLLTDCKIREIPTPRDSDEELEGETWFYAGESDVFPEEFRTFIGLSKESRTVFDPLHRDLFTPAYWRNMQDRLNRGEIAEILPYRSACRLHKEMP